MRRARVTYEGAIHHGMNRGYNGLAVFQEDDDKQVLIELMAKAQGLTKVSLHAYCIMDNHYHLIVQNNSGRMADFFKQLNGPYGTYYRKRHGGRGYVFQDRYKSSVIQDEAYLLLSLAYVLNNPVKAGLIKDFAQYPWSSAPAYFSGQAPLWLDVATIEDLFAQGQALNKFVNAQVDLEQLPQVKTAMGMIIGGEGFAPSVLERADRRGGRPSLERKRVIDFYFEPVSKVIMEFEQKFAVKVDELDTRTYAGKRLRAELLVRLKDQAGLRYVELAKMDYFADLSVNGLGAVYKRAKEKRRV